MLFIFLKKEKHRLRRFTRYYLITDNLMRNKFTRLIIILLVFCFASKVYGQQSRKETKQRKLDSLAKTVPGLNQKVQLNVIGGTIQQYLTGIASSNGLSISVDPKLNFTISDSYN